jgi:hypothetical protein
MRNFYTNSAILCPDDRYLSSESLITLHASLILSSVVGDILAHSGVLLSTKKLWRKSSVLAFNSLRTAALAWAEKVKTIARNLKVHRDKLPTVKCAAMKHLDDQGVWAEKILFRSEEG